VDGGPGAPEPKSEALRRRGSCDEHFEVGAHDPLHAAHRRIAADRVHGEPPLPPSLLQGLEGNVQPDLVPVLEQRLGAAGRLVVA
jgi:hypothetical protein